MQTPQIHISSQFSQNSRDYGTKPNEELEIRNTSDPIRSKNPSTDPAPGSLIPVQIQNCSKPFSSLHSIHHPQNSTNTPRQPQIKCYINKPAKTFCSECGEHTETLQRVKAGQAVYIWSLFLLFTTGVCCILPFIMQRCKDKELICIRCCSKKGMKSGECCLCE